MVDLRSTVYDNTLPRNERRGIMKKLSIILALLAVFCFLTAGNAFAGDPQCGVWMLSPGSNTSSLDATFKPIQGIPTNITTTTCSILTWKLVGQPSTCLQRTTFKPFWVVDRALPGSTTCKQPMMAHSQIDKEADASGLGVFAFEDSRNLAAIKTWYGKVIRQRIISTVFAPSGYYTSNQTAICSPDLGAKFDSGVYFAMNPEQEVLSSIEAEIISGKQGSTIITPSEYSEVEFNYVGSAPPAGWHTGYGTLHVLRQLANTVVVEIKKPLRGDLDGSGKVNAADYTIFRTDWLQSAMCGCGYVWP